MSEKPITKSDLVDLLYKSKPIDDKKEGWFVLKIIGGIAISIITLGLSSGLFWAINSITENTKNIASADARAETEKLLAAQRFEIIKDKLDGFGVNLAEVRSNTKNRFTREDWIRESEKGYSDVETNTESLKRQDEKIGSLDDRLDEVEHKVRALSVADQK